jgi:CheY-like chemotaxis protein
MTTIAVVNDDTPFLDLMHELLTDEGYTTLVHRVGDSAHTFVRNIKPDLVILDIRMEHPDSGWTVLELLRLDPRTTTIPVIVCSADGRFLKEKESQLRHKGCCILEKPFDLNDLLNVIMTALDPQDAHCGVGAAQES